MSSILDFGGIQHRVGSAGVAIAPRYELDARGEPWLEHQQWTINFRLVKQSGQTIDALVSTLKTTFSQTRDSIKLINFGGADSVHKIAAGESLGGVRVIGGPAFPKYTNGQMVTIRDVQVTVEATLARFVSPFQVVAFTEQTPMQAGGERWAMVQPNYGYGELQRTRDKQHSTFTQSGTVIYAGAYGPIPRPIFSVGQLGPPQITPRSPRRIGSGSYSSYVAYPIDYQYEFAAPITLTGLPTKWA